MPTNIRPVDAPDVLLTFAGFSACFDRLMGQPITVSPSSVGPVYPQNMGRNWTTYEDMRLVSLYASGVPYAEMGRELGRTPVSCQDRLRRIGYGCVK